MNILKVDINFGGRYWKQDDLWIARIESIEVEAKAATPYMCLLKLMETFEPKVASLGFNCSISVLDSGIFYILLKNINEDCL